MSDMSVNTAYNTLTSDVQNGDDTQTLAQAAEAFQSAVNDGGGNNYSQTSFAATNILNSLGDGTYNQQNTLDALNTAGKAEGLSDGTATVVQQAPANQTAAAPQAEASADTTASQASGSSTSAGQTSNANQTAAAPQAEASADTTASQASGSSTSAGQTSNANQTSNASQTSSADQTVSGALAQMQNDVASHANAQTIAQDGAAVQSAIQANGNHDSNLSAAVQNAVGSLSDGTYSQTGTMNALSNAASADSANLDRNTTVQTALNTMYNDIGNGASSQTIARDGEAVQQAVTSNGGGDSNTTFAVQNAVNSLSDGTYSAQGSMTAIENAINSDGIKSKS